MLTVVATYRTGPGGAQAVADLLAGHVAVSEQEPGCPQFLVHQASDDPTRFFLYETYNSAQAFAEHQRGDHLQQNIETTRALALIEREWHVCSGAPRHTLSSSHPAANGRSR